MRKLGGKRLRRFAAGAVFRANAREGGRRGRWGGLGHRVRFEEEKGVTETEEEERIVEEKAVMRRNRMPGVPKGGRGPERGKSSGTFGCQKWASFPITMSRV